METQFEDCVLILKTYFTTEQERLRDKAQNIESCLNVLAILEEMGKHPVPESSPDNEPAPWHMSLLEVIRQFV